ncbi:MAG: cupin domain-containing protein [Elusimicrobia bacterium]|nr:cupin domain-containing protein [Elusimicrobiota bacterium]
MEKAEATRTAGELSEKAARAAEWVDYQAGSVVSREILRRPTGTVTTFAFDKGQELSEHSAAFDALVLVTEGEGEISISGRPHRVKAGEMLLLPAGKPHAVAAVERFKMMLVMIRS